MPKRRGEALERIDPEPKIAVNIFCALQPRRAAAERIAGHTACIGLR
jgi:hypothetical protein